MSSSRLGVVTLLAALSLVGAGCVSVSSPSPAANNEAPSVDAARVARDKVMGPACSESGGTYILATSGCLCPSGFYLNDTTGKCVDMRITEVVTPDAVTTDAAVGTDGNTTTKTSADGKTTSSTAASAKISAAATAASDKKLQDDCAVSASIHLAKMKETQKQVTGDAYTGYSVSSHYNKELESCVAVISYAPKEQTLVSKDSKLQRIGFQNVVNVSNGALLASYTALRNVINGEDDYECFIDGNRYTLAVYKDYVRVVMEQTIK